MTTTTTDTRPARCRTCRHCKPDETPWWRRAYSWGSGYLCHRDDAEDIRHIIYAYDAKTHWPDESACPYYVAQEA